MTFGVWGGQHLEGLAAGAKARILLMEADRNSEPRWASHVTLRNDQITLRAMGDHCRMLRRAWALPCLFSPNLHQDDSCVSTADMVEGEAAAGCHWEAPAMVHARDDEIRT